MMLYCNWIRDFCLKISWYININNKNRSLINNHWINLNFKMSSHQKHDQIEKLIELEHEKYQ